MKEPDRKNPLEKAVSGAKDALLQQVLGNLGCISLRIRTAIAPGGELIDKDGTIVAKGKVIRFSGNEQVIVSRGSIYFPNTRRGDQCRITHK